MHPRYKDEMSNGILTAARGSLSTSRAGNRLFDDSARNTEKSFILTPIDP